MKGYNGKIARVDLCSRLMTIQRPSEAFYRQHLGERGIIIRTAITGWEMTSESEACLEGRIYG